MLRGKQAQIVRFADSGYDALICDGAIRSGKTCIMTLAFVDWAMRNFSDCNFGICGKTVLSARRNIVEPFMRLTYARKRYAMTDRRSDNAMVITAIRGGVEVTNKFYIFGGKDEASQDLVQGITLPGVLLDEVALMPQSFVNQAIARCSVSGSKWWFNCNPGHPEHWFKKEWIDRADSGEINALHLHFTLEDNPSLTPEIRQRYESQFSGVFYQRYILGEWKQAEGRVYASFDPDVHVTRDFPHGATDAFYISIDYGTANPFSAGLWRVDRQRRRAWREREYYYDSRKAGQQKTDEEYYAELEKLAGDYPISYIVVDPSAASFIECIRRHGRYRVRKAVNDVIDGIRVVSSLLDAGMIALSPDCRDSIREFSLYSWDDKTKTGEDKVIKEHDHAMDDIRYFCNTILRREFRWAEWR